MMYFPKLVSLGSHPKKSPCVLFFIVQKNLFPSPMPCRQIKLSGQMDAVRSAGVFADHGLRTNPGPSVSGPGGVPSLPGQWGVWAPGGPLTLLLKFASRTIRTNRFQNGMRFLIFNVFHPGCNQGRGGVLPASRAGSGRPVSCRGSPAVYRDPRFHR